MIFLKDDRIELRALEPEDLPHLYRWENDTSLWCLGSTITPYSRHALTEYLNLSSHHDLYETGQLRLAVQESSLRQAIGLVDLFDLDIHNRRAAVGILIDPNFRKQGRGTAALNLLASYAFLFLHLHQLYVHIPADNPASLALFRHCGYREAGLLAQWAIRPDASFVDTFLFQLLSSASPSQ
ncbi:MAG: GNAT family N-acetyltransferase [Tannerellaceae bacterium]|jgi:diamine N-acetyltransferase|nr:GNAT family N-acetyltransferase [Tannerellaceae bacterium]